MIYIRLSSSIARAALAKVGGHARATAIHAAHVTRVAIHAAVVYCHILQPEKLTDVQNRYFIDIHIYRYYTVHWPSSDTPTTHPMH